MYQTVFKDYPNLARALCRRAHQYNEVMELVERWEEEGRIFVIRPQGKTVSRLESKPEVLEDFYQHGIEQMKEHFRGNAEFPGKITEKMERFLQVQACIAKTVRTWENLC